MGLTRAGCLLLALTCGASTAAAAVATPAYQTSGRARATETVVLTGRDLDIEALIAVARHGARVDLSEAARRREADNYGLLLEAQAEAVPVYLLNRGGGLAREQQILEGDAQSPENRDRLARRELAAMQRGARMGAGPEISDEALVRATMTIRANGMSFETPSPQLARMLLDLLNHDITPVMQSTGSVGESDFGLLPNISATMVGSGEAWYQGTRMPAAEALRRAGLKPLEPFAVDSSTFANSNAYSTALAAFLVAEGRHALEWADLTHAIDLDGMNGSITPLSTPVQRKRPDRWLNWDAARVLELLRGSYLFDGDPTRILADADSLRASSIRQGAAWRAWANLRDAVLLQMNSSDHNPVVSAGLSPEDSWELATPQMLKFYVHGGPLSQGQHGYIVSSANWDPYPIANAIEAFTNALANLGVVIAQRSQRFNNPYFTVLGKTDGIVADQVTQLAPQGDAYVTMHLWQELSMLAAPVTAAGIATDMQGNGDIEAQAVLKAERGRQAVDLTLWILGQDLLTGGYWMNLRALQDPARHFGPGPEAALKALRARIPWLSDPAARGSVPPATIAHDLIATTPLATLFPAAGAEPGGRPAIGVTDGPVEP